MSKPEKQQRLSSQFAGVGEQFKNRALKQAAGVPWPRLAAAVNQYNDWLVFSLWLRAVGDAAKSIPPVVKQELEAKIPGLLARVEEDLRTKPEDKPGHRLWNLADSWLTVNILLEPKVQGWLDAVHYFASMSLAYMKTWAHWERVNREWRGHPPADWPNYQQWQKDVAAVSRLANPDSVPQQVLDAVLSVSADWGRIWPVFLELLAFSLWMELILDVEGAGSHLVAEECSKRYPGFRFSSPEVSSREAVRELNSWAACSAIGTDNEQVFAALAWHAQHHPAYYAMRNYAADCHQAWSDECPNRLPSFDEWRQAADNYFA